MQMAPNQGLQNMYGMQMPMMTGGYNPAMYGAGMGMNNGMGMGMGMGLGMGTGMNNNMNSMGMSIGMGHQGMGMGMQGEMAPMETRHRDQIDRWRSSVAQ